MSLTSNASFPRAGFRRRMASWLYDALIAIAVYMTAGAASFLIISLLVHFGAFDLQGYEHLSDAITNTYWLLLPNELWKLAWVAFFFIWFWSKSGQTLGMKAWRLKVQNQDGSLMTKTTAIKRLLPTLLGLGNFAVLVDRKNKLSIQDRLTDTEVVLLTLEANRGRL
ncbi:RDD family protein [Colwellia sp. Arc7-635]|uniref:RDD family protein n=1 Tax=Colwellia sp. Arc7-635 TaxID=2497879 RepID=UPI000F859AB1|nr:RDD family protein [Colwellia sp. Arc7-635]AZQ85653.1 RDD family protein [Colwellia sp. Arc7-635]